MPVMRLINRVMEYRAPELLPLWLRHGHQVPEDLTRDLQSGGVSHNRREGVSIL